MIVCKITLTYTLCYHWVDSSNLIIIHCNGACGIKGYKVCAILRASGVKWK